MKLNKQSSGVGKYLNRHKEKSTIKDNKKSKDEPCPFCVGRIGRICATCEDCLGSGKRLFT